jgi:hypothetical protein
MVVDAFGVKDVRCCICFEPAELYHTAGVQVKKELPVGVIVGFYCIQHWLEELKTRETIPENKKE